LQPSLAAAIAAQTPANPPPITTVSYFIIELLIN